MTGHAPTLTRRDASRLILVAPFAVGVTGVAQAMPAAEGLAEALRGIVLPYRPAELHLVRQSETSDGTLEAVVRLTWAPGQRQRLFRAASREALFAEIETYFRALA